VGHEFISGRAPLYHRPEGAAIVPAGPVQKKDTRIASASDSRYLLRAAFRTVYLTVRLTALAGGMRSRPGKFLSIMFV
jgi:hypothetical protein